ncbi:hypothetical protein ACSVC9_07260 [Clostridium sp. LBM24168]
MSRHHRRHYKSHNERYEDNNTYMDTDYKPIEENTILENTSDTTNLLGDENHDTYRSSNKNKHEYNNCSVGSMSFSDNLSRYIGKPVTIFTSSCGNSGFSGVLIAVNKYFIRLISKIGPAPDYPLNNSCSSDNLVENCYDPYKLDDSCYKNNKDPNLGSLVDIPINKIAAFVHNAL